MAPLTRITLVLVALMVFACAALAQTASNTSETPHASAAPSTTVALPPHASSGPLTLGEVVFTFVTGLMTIVINTVRGYILLPPL
ncbi:hypothetical protein EV178_003455 [Coemansia sp. RSA 1646]|nr:hypothetical protein EV178_003455 [Coemansia sp. RSA 1646]